jgi:potassium efflux system protein
MKILSYCLAGLLATAFASGIPAVSSAQKILAGADEETVPQEQVSPATPAALREKAAALEERIAKARQLEASGEAARLGLSPERGTALTEKIIFIQSLYENTAVLLEHREELRLERSTLQERMASPQATLAEAPPYSISLYEGRLALVSAARRLERTLQMEIDMGRKLEVSFREEKASTGSQWRRLKEAVDSQAAGEVSEEELFALRDAAVDFEQATALLQHQEVANSNLTIRQEVAALKVSLALREVDRVRGQLAFSAQELEKLQQRYDEERDQLQQRLDKLSHEQNRISAAWVKARQSVQEAVTPEQRQQAEAFLKEREAWRDTYQKSLSLTSLQLALVEHSRKMAQHRFSLVNKSATDDDLRQWKADLVVTSRHLQETHQVQQQYLTNLQQKTIVLQQQIDTGGLSSDMARRSRNRLAAIKKLAENLETFLSEVLEAQDRTEWLLEDIDRELGQLSFLHGLSLVGQAMRDLWQAEIWVVDDQPVTVKGVLLVIIVLVVGMVTAKYAILLFTRRLSRSATFRQTTILAIQKVLTYGAYFTIFLMALRLVNIPITAFAFIGGALAIGVGFGAQNLINNLISGIIIMTEQPISIGDLIELEGVLGRVEEIGARCTVVRTGENIDILIPNSSFLDKSITNWTHSDRRIRASVTVGVSYTSPVEVVQETLLAAMNDLDSIIRLPRPFVLFEDFGDNALVFSGYFWVQVERNLQRRRIESALRFRIEHRFREKGIVIAYPQRDLHFDPDRPLRVAFEKNGAGSREG